MAKLWQWSRNTRYDLGKSKFVFAFIDIFAKLFCILPRPHSVHVSTESFNHKRVLMFT